MKTREILIEGTHSSFMRLGWMFAYVPVLLRAAPIQVAPTGKRGPGAEGIFDLPFLLVGNRFTDRNAPEWEFPSPGGRSLVKLSCPSATKLGFTIQLRGPHPFTFSGKRYASVEGFSGRC